MVGDLESDDLEIGNLLNTYFDTVFTNTDITSNLQEVEKYLKLIQIKFCQQL